MDKNINYDLVLENMKLVYYIINTYFSDFTNKDDYISIGTIGLMKATKDFDSNKNVKFSTYAYKCILNSVKGEIIKEFKHNNVISLNNSVNNDADSSELIELIPDDYNLENEFEKEETNKEMFKFFDKCLDETEKKIICLYYGFYGRCYNIKEIEKITNFARFKINNILATSIRKLKKEMVKKQIVKKIDF